MDKLNLSVRTLGNPFISKSDELPNQSDHVVNIGDIVTLQHESNLLSVSVTSYDEQELLYSGQLQGIYKNLSTDEVINFKEENIFEIKKT